MKDFIIPSLAFDHDMGTPARTGAPVTLTKDTSNPYFTYDPSKCIVCSRCVRACEEVQGTFALTIEGRHFAGHAGTVRHHHLRLLRCGLLV